MYHHTLPGMKLSDETDRGTGYRGGGYLCVTPKAA